MSDDPLNRELRVGVRRSENVGAAGYTAGAPPVRARLTDWRGFAR
jgi:hypothetical protein